MNRTPDPYATAAETAVLLREGRLYRRDRMRAADMVAVDEAASLLGVDASTVAAWIDAGRCIGMLGPDRAMRVARWQFEPSVWPSILPIAEGLGTSDGWQVLDFLETAAPALDGWTPRVALEQGTPLPRVLDVTRGEAH